MESYKTESKIEKLLELGHLSALGKNLKPRKGQIHTESHAAKDTVLAHIRDMGRSVEDALPTRFDTCTKDKIPMVSCEEWLYVFEDGKWMCTKDKKTWLTIPEAIKKENT